MTLQNLAYSLGQVAIHFNPVNGYYGVSNIGQLDTTQLSYPAMALVPSGDMIQRKGYSEYSLTFYVLDRLLTDSANDFDIYSYSLETLKNYFKQLRLLPKVISITEEPTMRVFTTERGNDRVCGAYSTISIMIEDDFDCADWLDPLGGHTPDLDDDPFGPSPSPDTGETPGGEIIDPDSGSTPDTGETVEYPSFDWWDEEYNGNYRLEKINDITELNSGDSYVIMYEASGDTGVFVKKCEPGDKKTKAYQGTEDKKGTYLLPITAETTEGVLENPESTIGVFKALGSGSSFYLITRATGTPIYVFDNTALYSNGTIPTFNIGLLYYFEYPPMWDYEWGRNEYRFMLDEGKIKGLTNGLVENAYMTLRRQKDGPYQEIWLVPERLREDDRDAKWVDYGGYFGLYKLIQVQ